MTPDVIVENEILHYLESKKRGATILDVTANAVRQHYQDALKDQLVQVAVRCVNKLIREGLIRVERPAALTARFGKDGELEAAKSSGIRLFHDSLLEILAYTANESCVAVQFEDLHRWRYTSID